MAGAPHTEPRRRERGLFWERVGPRRVPCRHGTRAVPSAAHTGTRRAHTHGCGSCAVGAHRRAGAPPRRVDLLSRTCRTKTVTIHFSPALTGRPACIERGCTVKPSAATFRK
eukprot:6976049-Prymnesium_polylepis.2